MLYLLPSQSTEIVKQMLLLPNFGLLLTPQSGSREKLGYANTPWAIDNGCFSQGEKFNLDKYMKYLHHHPKPRFTCLFATAPDVVGDMAQTLTRSMPVLPLIKTAGYRPCLVLQNGAQESMIPWDEIDAIFIGGTDEWKDSWVIASLVQTAKEKNKWVHMGRVNSERRILYANRIGCDSVDGTSIAFAPNQNGRKLLNWMSMAEWQKPLF